MYAYWYCTKWITGNDMRQTSAFVYIDINSFVFIYKGPLRALRMISKYAFSRWFSVNVQQHISTIERNRILNTCFNHTFWPVTIQLGPASILRRPFQAWIFIIKIWRSWDRHILISYTGKTSFSDAFWSSIAGLSADNLAYISLPCTRERQKWINFNQPRLTNNFEKCTVICYILREL